MQGWAVARDKARSEAQVLHRPNCDPDVHVTNRLLDARLQTLCMCILLVNCCNNDLPCIMLAAYTNPLNSRPCLHGAKSRLSPACRQPPACTPSLSTRPIKPCRPTNAVCVPPMTHSRSSQCPGHTARPQRGHPQLQSGHRHTHHPWPALRRSGRGEHQCRDTRGDAGLVKHGVTPPQPQSNPDASHTLEHVSVHTAVRGWLAFQVMPRAASAWTCSEAPGPVPAPASAVDTAQP